MTKIYVLTEDVGDRAQVGELFVKCNKYDYGMSRDDTLVTGIEHVSVSRDLENGNYPFVSVPRHLLSERD